MHGGLQSPCKSGLHGSIISSLLLLEYWICLEYTDRINVCNSFISHGKVGEVVIFCEILEKDLIEIIFLGLNLVSY